MDVETEDGMISSQSSPLLIRAHPSNDRPKSLIVTTEILSRPVFPLNCFATLVVSNDYFLLMPRENLNISSLLVVCVLSGARERGDKINEFNVWCHKKNIYKTSFHSRSLERGEGEGIKQESGDMNIYEV